MNTSDPIQICNEIADDYLEEYNEPSDHIEVFVKSLPDGSKVLDLGCGPGVDTAHLASKGFKVHAIDGAANMIALARKQAPDATFETGDMRKLDYGHEQYDGIIASYSLIHIPKADIPELFTRLVDALKPSGLLFIGLQLGNSEEVELDEPFNPKLKIFLNIFSKEDVHKMLAEHNLTLLEEYERLAERKEEFNFTKYCALARKDNRE